MIICFSGNGNTLAVARELGQQLGERVVRLFGDNLLHPSASPQALGDEERVIWAFPVYSWGVPPVMRRYIREAVIDGADRATHFMVATMGDDAGFTADMWRRDMAHRGWRTAGAYGVIMPNTYVSFPGFDIDTPEVAAAKLAAMPARVGAIASSIAAGETGDRIKRGSMPWLKTKVIYPLFIRTAMSPRRFRVDTTLCIGCASCARACPLSNITMTPQQALDPAPNSTTKPRQVPEWGHRCATCLACFHVCPTGAVSRGPISRGKSRYPGPSTN